MTHHPSEATLLAYAAGRLPVPHRLVLDVHFAACPPCRTELRLGEAVGGALLEALEPAALAPDALDRALAGLDGPTAPAAAPRPVPRLETLATGHWLWLGPGIRLMPLQRRDADGARLDLIRVAPGRALPEHGHGGAEFTCVLRGGFADETGEYRLGDFSEQDAGVDHRPVALPIGEDCICLLATAGRLKAQGWLARLVQPLIDV